MTAELMRQLKGDEGVRHAAYQDHLGYWTIGVGRLIDDRRGGRLRPHEIDFLLENDVADRVEALSERLKWFKKLDPARQGVLLNMAFQLGTEGLMAFKTTLGHVEAGRYLMASESMLQSKWAGQTPARAKRLAEQMRTGEWHYAPGA